MHNKKLTFDEIYNFSITNCGQFKLCSKLLHKNESRSIKFIPDRSALLTKIFKEKIIRNAVSDAQHNVASTYCEGIYFKTLCYEPMYVTLVMEIDMQR